MTDRQKARLGSVLILLAPLALIACAIWLWGVVAFAVLVIAVLAALALLAIGYALGGFQW